MRLLAMIPLLGGALAASIPMVKKSCGTTTSTAFYLVSVGHNSFLHDYVKGATTSANFVSGVSSASTWSLTSDGHLTADGGSTIASVANPASAPSTISFIEPGVEGANYLTCSLYQVPYDPVGTIALSCSGGGGNAFGECNGANELLFVSSSNMPSTCKFVGVWQTCS